MTAAAQRSVTIVYTGDVGGTQELTAAENSPSPASVRVETLAESGSVTLSVPTGAVSLTIMKPSDNTIPLRLKAVDADTGIQLHLTDPDSISLDPGQASIVVATGSDGTAAALTVTLRFFWT